LQFHPVAESHGLGQCNECPRSHEKLTDVKLDCKLFIIKLSGIRQNKIDHKKQEN